MTGGCGKAQETGEWLAEAIEMWDVKMVVDFPHTLECMGNNMKQYEELASVDFVVLRSQLSPSVSVL